MDRQTLAAYDREAAVFASDWHAQPAPADLHDIIKRFFVRGGRTADIGCGSGREVGWLNANGYRAQGFDASDGLLTEARRRYPDASFVRAELPELAGLAETSFDNVLCETVLMHLARNDVMPSVRRIRAILRPGGILYLSWRVTENDDQRDNHGRLYAVVDLASLRALFAADAILLDEAVVSASSGDSPHGGEDRALTAIGDIAECARNLEAAIRSPWMAQLVIAISLRAREFDDRPDGICFCFRADRS